MWNALCGAVPQVNLALYDTESVVTVMKAFGFGCAVLRGCEEVVVLGCAVPVLHASRCMAQAAELISRQ